MQSLYTIIDNTMYSRLLLHTFLVVLCHRKVILGQYHGSYHPSAGRVAIGPYRPWEGRYPPPVLGIPYPTLPAGHPGYQTNIVIDQTGKANSVVEITTEDLSTGLEVGRTEWSGPGTLTLSAIASFLERPRQRKRESPLVLAGKEVSHYPAGHPKSEYELVEVPEYHHPQYPVEPPRTVMGTPCRTRNDCTGALHAVCSTLTNCQGSSSSCSLKTCGCPPHHYLHLNTLDQHHGGHSGYQEWGREPRSKRRSLKYYEECRYDHRRR